MHAVKDGLPPPSGEGEENQKSLARRPQVVTKPGLVGDNLQERVLMDKTTTTR